MAETSFHAGVCVKRVESPRVESKIQKVTVDKDTWHRVRIGPLKNLEALEETRGKLRAAQIDALVIRVGE